MSIIPSQPPPTLHMQTEDTGGSTEHPRPESSTEARVLETTATPQASAPGTGPQESSTEARAPETTATPQASAPATGPRAQQPQESSTEARVLETTATPQASAPATGPRAQQPPESSTEARALETTATPQASAPATGPRAQQPQPWLLDHTSLFVGLVASVYIRNHRYSMFSGAPQEQLRWGRFTGFFMKKPALPRAEGQAHQQKEAAQPSQPDLGGDHPVPLPPPAETLSS